MTRYFCDGRLIRCNDDNEKNIDFIFTKSTDINFDSINTDYLGETRRSYGKEYWTVRIGANTKIGVKLTLYGSCSIGSNCVVGHFVSLGANTRVHNNVTLGESCSLYMRAKVLPNSNLGMLVILGGGAIISNSVTIDNYIKVRSHSIVPPHTNIKVLDSNFCYYDEYKKRLVVNKRKIANLKLIEKLAKEQYRNRIFWPLVKEQLNDLREERGY